MTKARPSAAEPTSRTHILPARVECPGTGRSVDGVDPLGSQERQPSAWATLRQAVEDSGPVDEMGCVWLEENRPDTHVITTPPRLRVELPVRPLRLSSIELVDGGAPGLLCCTGPDPRSVPVGVDRVGIFLHARKSSLRPTVRSAPSRRRTNQELHRPKLVS